MLPPDYLTVYQNFSPIPQNYTPKTTNLIMKNFLKIFQFRRKTYIVWQIITRKIPSSTFNSIFSSTFNVSIFYWIICCFLEISHLFHKSARTGPQIWLKTFLKKFPRFPEKPTLCAKFEQKWFCWDFKVLPPDYVTINQNFSPIPQFYTPYTTILTKKNFWKISQFSRKTYIVCKIWTKMVLMGFWGFTPWLCDNQSKFHSYSTNLHTEPYHFDQKEFLENFAVFQKNLHCVQNLNKNGLNGILRFYPLIMWQSIKISVLFHKSTHRILLFQWKRIFGKFPSFPEKLTLCAKFGQKLSVWDFEMLPPDYVTIKISVLVHKSRYQTH